MTKAPLPVRLYRSAANLVAPLAYRRVARKLKDQGTDPSRIPERMGHAAAGRPDGRLLWFHAASVGESLSVLRLIEQMGRDVPDLSFLITSGTATSAEIVGRRLPPRTQHQFAPLDALAAVTRFLTHWRPDAAIFVESELWPQMLLETHAAGIPIALINARISDRSARNWARFRTTAQYLMQHFTMIHCQDARTQAHMRSLGFIHATQGVNLKSLAGPLPYDDHALSQTTKTNGTRFVWLAASTHPGEDEIVLDAHRALLKERPDALLVIAPRHPERADDIERLIGDAGLLSARRSKFEPIKEQTQVYLADTLGEMGLWYRLCPLTCLCGSFSDVGGHNPYEPAYAGSAILHGPLYANFGDTYADLHAAGAAQQVADAQALGATITKLAQSPDELAKHRDTASAFAAAQSDELGSFAQTLSKALGLG
ncbi:3-deoxy-D-manno-octulosonic acid transferase [Roseovarius phycicola]|uniref:3-deoxy-D-manno-octulosonic acid transferase n=1 Tax=Roseovarius phycicola TaxID=3080976 RepID=A0ABZ2HHY3_9RHOB